jgi:L-iditol 2-dehydrogenase
LKVAVYYSNNDIRIEEREIPKIGEKEILLKVRASGICGSDVLEWYRKGKAPVILGHEVAGDVVEVGKEVKGVKEGDKVVVAHHVPCNTCYFCLRGHHTVCETLRKTNFYPGGFSEFIRVPEINVDRGIFPFEKISYEEASLTEPLACVIRAHRLLSTSIEDSVFVIGCGTAGLLHIKFLKAIGVRRIFAADIIDYRIESAKKAGADFAFQSEKGVAEFIRSKNDSRLADKVILCTGSPSAVEMAFETVERGGKILFFATPEPDVGIPLPVNRMFWRTEISFVSSYGGSPRDYADAIELIENGRIDVKSLITHRLPLSEASYGFKLVSNGKECIKVVLIP